MEYFVLDFETRSKQDIKKVGAWRYAEDPSTSIICLAYEQPEVGVGLWNPILIPEDPPPGSLCRIADLAAGGKAKLVAHNAEFEQAIWAYHMVPWGLPHLPPECWVDTMASAAHYGLPLGLEELAKAVAVADKDMEGNKLLQKVTKPFPLTKQQLKDRGLDPKLRKEDRPVEFNEDPELLERVADYCIQDVRVERQVFDLIGDLPPEEREVWLADQRMNQRGMELDTAAVRAAQDIADEEHELHTSRLRELTGGEVETVNQGDKLLAWIAKANGGKAPLDMKAETVQEWLAADNLSPAAREALEIRRKLSKSSTAKLKAMLTTVGYDFRIRGMLRYQGATATGRWAGRLVQPQNLPGGDDELSPHELIELIKLGRGPLAALAGDVFTALSHALRPMFRAGAGRKFMAGDYNAIEARVVLALAGQYDKAKLLADGFDVYANMAETIYRLPAGTVTKADRPKQRQVGKNAVLGLGFQCGAKTFVERFQPDMSEAEAQPVVDTYRYEWAPAVPKLWRGLEGAAVAAVYRGEESTYAGVTYRKEIYGNLWWMSAELPSGRKLWYFKPSWRLADTPWGDKQVKVSYMAYKDGRLQKLDLYGGILTENVVQALARDIMANALVEADRRGYRPVLTVHDELVCEVPEDMFADPDAVMEDVMLTQPQWVWDTKIPLAIECWYDTRFQK